LNDARAFVPEYEGSIAARVALSTKGAPKSIASPRLIFTASSLLHDTSAAMAKIEINNFFIISLCFVFIRDHKGDQTLIVKGVY
jgi:hypothetical protein